MGEPFLGEIRMFGFGFPPRGWLACTGALLPINQYAALFSILGTNYGGDGMRNFALPDLRSRVPIHPGRDFFGNAYSLGQVGGEEAHALAVGEIPPHVHSLNASKDAADANTPAGTILAQSQPQAFTLYATTARRSTPLAPTTIATSSGGVGHNNLQPYLAVNFCIAMQGVFPSRN
jgi:microcystin-dependent protein